MYTTMEHGEGCSTNTWILENDVVLIDNSIMLQIVDRSKYFGHY